MPTHTNFRLIGGPCDGQTLRIRDDLDLIAATRIEQVAFRPVTAGLPKTYARHEVVFYRRWFIPDRWRQIHAVFAWDRLTAEDVEKLLERENAE